MKTKTKKTTAKNSHAKEVETTNQAEVTPAPAAANTANLPLSESNKMQPEAGVQVHAPEGSTETVIKTDPYSHITKEQAQFKEGEQPFLTKQPEIANMQAVLNEIYRRHNVDLGQQKIYNQQLGLL